MKASLALQHGTVPPNMLLDELNPRVQPFCSNLRIPLEAKDWPETSAGCPRRASVNSFGFGGTNAHAIIESFVGQPHNRSSPQDDDAKGECISLAPFNFSAASEPSLRSSLAAYASFLRENRGISLWDFAWTLNARRSRLPVRASFCASSAGELAEKLEEGFGGASERVTIASRIATDGHGTGRPRLLGVFTGQGAQWASMGRHLLESSKLVGSCFQSLQTALDRLAQHAPDWSLRDELLRDVAASRINDAAFSQPLCTAVQIALVQLLRATGVIFTAVVGHSSGEIAAAYAAGYLSAEDAIRIAYFRGLFLDRACAGGAMLAVGTTLEDASKLCNLRSMQGRICIAAINSPTSITLSGDSDAIQDAQEIFEDENKFTRLVKVDKAYHSHHMTPIADIYLQAIRDCGVQVQARQPGVNHPVWISSVKGEDVEGLNLDVLRGQYWRDNMRDPVVFSRAVQCALQTHGPFTAVLEVGPHPALRTPTSDTITATTGLSIPYVATLIRGQNDTEAFASALGNLWKNGMMIDLGALVQQPLKMLKNLPKYAWDHDRTFWHETRRARALRNHNGTSFPHPLLGTRCEDEAEGELRFRNHLNMRDIPWLADHRIQDQVLLPGTAYICACLEAVMIAFPIDREDVRLVEFRDIVIRKALVFPEGVEGAELVLCIKLVDEDEHRIRANFQFSSSSDAVKESTVLVENCSGEVIVIRRKRSDEVRRDALPPARQLAPGRTILNLQPSTFYDWARELGYGYEGCFRGLSEIRRRINTSAGRLLVPQQTMFVVHPVTLDLAIQGVLLAYSCPGDGRLRSLHMPTRVDLLRIDLAACQAASKVEHLSFFSSVAPSTDLVGHVDIHVAGRTLVQIQGLHATPVNPPTADNDTKHFFEMILEPEMPMGSPVIINSARLDTEHDRRTNAERVAYFYFRGLSEAFPPGARNDLQWHHVRLLEYVDSCIAKFANGTYLYTYPEWMADSEGDIDRILRRFSSVIDFKLMTAANDGLLRSIHDRGQTNMWEVLTRDNMLDDYYRHGLGMPEYLNAMTNIVAQLSHRFAHMDILEVGAGTGAATGAILNRLDGAFRSFTFTDISNGFFPGASTKFAKFESQMKFQLLDIEKSVTNQGFVEGSYDLVIASLVLHATSDLAQSLANLRTLLRAGGYLIMLELTETDVFRIGLLFGGFPGWWLGDRADGRHLSPCVSVKVWETLMQETGFSKIEAITPPDPELLAPLTILVCQAVDERIQFLRNPMMPGPQGLGLKCLTIIGGGELISAEFYTLIKRHYQVVRQLVSLADVATQELPAAGTVISLLDVMPDEVPVFQSLTEVDFSAIRKIFRLSKTILWVSRGCLHDRPYNNMFRGLARSAKLETSNLRVQTLDIDIGDPFEWQIVAQCLLKLEVIGVWEEENRLGGLLWQREPELFVRGGVVSIPRLRQSVMRNNRYNSARRFISHEVSVKENLGIQKGVVNLKGTQISTSPFGGETRLVYSLLKAVLIGTHGVFLSVGERIDTRQQVLVLSKSLESQICAPLDWSVPLSPGSDQRKALLLLQAQLLAQTIVRTIVPTRQLVVFNSDELLGDALFQLTSDKAIQLLLVTTRDVDFKRGWTRVHPYETLQTIQQMLPSRLFTFVDMAEREEDSELLRHCLPRGCKVIRRSELLMDDAELDFSPTAVRAVADHLQAAYLACTATIFDSVDLSPVPTFDLHALTMPDKINGVIKAPGPGVQGIVSWLASEKVRLQIQPASSQLSFRSDRTYWLVGLTGGLGPGLCEFMADRGAAYIALSSRHPRVDEGWIRLMASRGCVVRVFEK
ncbi:putative acyl transferase acyl hydrolase lysophospholipase [Rosellinia necatrix]|uniref:Putative acyl transferase acyl hydrolase lysophospholipase n=1 Tax=Rosellinia necatrix TaxID=77044 RepID=A0A1S8A640_ROSNE|nr:putative acyl transferase acyl hydrolase lysophospholipase [Rosellinia necatrix]